MKTTVQICWTRHKSSVTFSFLFLSIQHTSLCYSYKHKTTSTSQPMVEKSCSQNRTVEVLKWHKSSELTESLCSHCKSFRPPVWMLWRTEKMAGNLFGATFLEDKPSEQDVWTSSEKCGTQKPSPGPVSLITSQPDILVVQKIRSWSMCAILNRISDWCMDRLVSWYWYCPPMSSWEDRK